MIEFNSAKYLYDIEGVNRTHIQLDLGNNKFKHVLIDPNSADYQEIMSQVEEGTLTIADAD
tara:strand:- start:32 stop:214 length:183 start_codon:yes stop_codon:yes gene_type:complete